MVSRSIKVSRLVRRTTAEGPGLRSALWVQGCSVRCSGCFNPHTWDPHHGQEVLVSDVVAELSAAPEIEGTTLLGGEPFDQAAAVADVADALQEQGLGVITFTGHTLENLQAREDVGVARLLGSTDLLIDGPYRRDMPDTRRPLVGSTNQGFHCLSERYHAWATQLQHHSDRVEITLHPDGRINITGWLSDRQRLPLIRAIRVSDARADTG